MTISDNDNGNNAPDGEEREQVLTTEWKALVLLLLLLFCRQKHMKVSDGVINKSHLKLFFFLVHSSHAKTCLVTKEQQMALL